MIEVLQKPEMDGRRQTGINLLPIGSKKRGFLLFSSRLETAHIALHIWLALNPFSLKFSLEQERFKIVMNPREKTENV
jgi:hypothetical protein